MPVSSLSTVQHLPMQKEEEESPCVHVSCLQVRNVVRNAMSPSFPDPVYITKTSLPRWRG